MDVAQIQPGWSRPESRQTVGLGMPATTAVPELLNQARCRRVLLVTTRSLSQEDGAAKRLASEMAGLHVDIIADIAAHSPREDVARIAAALEGADAVVTLGGGSVCDATKVARLCAANGVRTLRGVDDWLDADGPREAATVPPTIPFVAVPTTLSAAEYLPMAGIMDMRHTRKAPVRHSDLAPDFVVLDGAMGTATPPRLWAGTGARAIDHAVETWCSVKPTPYSDATALKALELLLPGLRRSAGDPGDADARLACLVGSWLSTKGVAAGVSVGASHGIGHALGGVTGMAHGETSAAMLPHVLAFNAVVNGARQQDLAQRLRLGETPLAQTIASLFTELGLPNRLRDAGVMRDDLTAVSSAAMEDHWTARNPRKIDSEAMLLLLDAAW